MEKVTIYIHMNEKQKNVEWKNYIESVGEARFKTVEVSTKYMENTWK
jgi:hypothetical protein